MHPPMLPLTFFITTTFLLKDMNGKSEGCPMSLVEKIMLSVEEIWRFRQKLLTFVPEQTPNRS